MDRHEIRRLLVAAILGLLGGLGVLALTLAYAQSNWYGMFDFLAEKGLTAFYVIALLVLLLGLGMLAWPLIRAWAADARDVVLEKNDYEKEQPK